MIKIRPISSNQTEVNLAEAGIKIFHNDEMIQILEVLHSQAAGQIEITKMGHGFKLDKAVETKAFQLLGMSNFEMAKHTGSIIKL